MTQGFLDFNSYTFAGGFTVQRGRDLIIPESLVLSQTMLVKWQIRQLAKGVTIDQIPPAVLSASLEIQGLGVLNHADHQILPSQQGRDIVQLLTIDPSLPHQLKFSQVSDLVTNSVLEFYSSSVPEFYSSNLSMSTTNNPAIIDPTCMGIKLYNNGTVAVAYDTYLDLTKKAATPQLDNLIQPGGETNITAEEAGMGVLLYTLTAIPVGKTASILITQEYPAAV